MESASYAVSKIHELVVSDSYFDTPCVREYRPPDDDDAPSPDQARKIYLKSIKKAEKIEKQIDEALNAIEALGNLERQKEAVATSLASIPAAAATSAHSKPRKRQRPLPRPPHMDRAPTFNEPVAAKVASHELWILGIVQKVNNTPDGVVEYQVRVLCANHLSSFKGRGFLRCSKAH